MKTVLAVFLLALSACNNPTKDCSQLVTVKTVGACSDTVCQVVLSDDEGMTIAMVNGLPPIAGAKYSTCLLNPPATKGFTTAQPSPSGSK